MKSIFQEIEYTDNRLAELNEQIENTKNLPYYKVFDRPEEQKRDLRELYEARKTVLELRYLKVENLLLECQKELARIANQQKEHTKLKTA